ncbi:hypothetical protein ORV05_05050 [Amycolatopsis cynarae]|uniref:Peptidase C1A papain C-terminal domain-containing protein n=1 Tax=Amycolatopsis cynarae TaxID=2995223 RepID=A0ABY7B5D9_9PSEU|nr:C1 family peptidase [Amycolatopsis sp. HUAS 11-8]WAL67160.1 hypothetical protein ORV05_05050 [Amycolatopsis sp. HUAS 11-8]
MTTFRYLKELSTNPYRLGRHQVHDALVPERDAHRHLRHWFDDIRSVTHREIAPVFDQGRTGSCTANAALGCLVTEPFATGVIYTEADAVALYELETKLDDSQIPGEYPPDDTGSTGPWSMQALEQQGKIKSFVHTRSSHLALRLLNHGPLSLGVPWLTSMFTVDDTNTIVVNPTSGLAGGHQVCVVGNDVDGQRVLIRNSWGAGWGEDGHAWLTWSALDYLLHEGGDVVQPVV